MLFRSVAAVVNDWQLSGIYNYTSGGRYSIGYTYQGVQAQNLSGSNEGVYQPRVLIVGDPGSGCSDNQYQQFNTDAFRAPVMGSDGLESGNSYLGGCPTNIWDLAIQRNIRLGGGRQVSLQVQMFNAFNNVIYNNRQTTMNTSFTNLTTTDGQAITNFQYNPDGSLVQTRLLPNNAGFGAVTGAQGLRSVQARVSFQF